MGEQERKGTCIYWGFNYNIWFYVYSCLWIYFVYESIYSLPLQFYMLWWHSYRVMLLLLLLSRFSRVRLHATPQTAAHQAPPSPGFSRQEHWRGLPFPSPMHESEKWKWSRSVVSDSATPWTAAHQAPPSMKSSRQEYWSGVPLPNKYIKSVQKNYLTHEYFLIAEQLY